MNAVPPDAFGFGANGFGVDEEPKTLVPEFGAPKTLFGAVEVPDALALVPNGEVDMAGLPKANVGDAALVPNGFGFASPTVAFEKILDFASEAEPTEAPNGLGLVVVLLIEVSLFPNEKGLPLLTNVPAPGGPNSFFSLGFETSPKLNLGFATSEGVLGSTTDCVIDVALANFGTPNGDGAEVEVPNTAP